MNKLFLKQALYLLDQIDINNTEVTQAKELLSSSVDKTAAVTDLIHDPKFQNIINLLTPFMVNYKVNQVIKLLQEMAKEQKKYDPETGMRRWIS
jgi:hypothetical protein